MPNRGQALKNELKRIEDDELGYLIAKVVKEKLSSKNIFFKVKQYIELQGEYLTYSDIYIPEYRTHIMLNQEKNIDLRAVENEEILSTSPGMIYLVDINGNIKALINRVNTILDELIGE